MGSSRSFAIVQVQAVPFKKGDTAVYNHLEDFVPCHSNWDELIEDRPKPPQPDEPRLMTPFDPDDVIITEDVIGLYFSSVGDWAFGYQSFFEYEVEMVGIEEALGNSLEDIVKEVKRALEVDKKSILTIWECRYSVDYFGEHDYDYDYCGVFDPAALV